MTDWNCDDLFDCGHAMLCSPVSRLVCDMERFREDAQEAMSVKGMGAVYTRTSDGAILQQITAEEREDILRCYYDPHHATLTRMVDERLEIFGRCLIVDGHSFPAKPLPYEFSQDTNRPDICIGSDDFHTPAALVETTAEFLRSKRYTVAVNTPFSGTLVPMKYYRRDTKVQSIMIEINRGLYWRRSQADYRKVKETIDQLLNRMFLRF